ncbi:fumarylacetoacetate hydrolase family protein [Sphingomonas crocodyli]|uniref:FAA hydrolase family protein n=1 Tax=Sphingomonas crocodyli TaxID=1979270 RepID=A0A437M5P3_9SPHN|nr:fumarylacetoacetate hydrolase family protein [Sphingomonas crocodyli]RVT92959.1 FAA hydrolase family protein [Sphingomonas crocodyli]
MDLAFSLPTSPVVPIAGEQVHYPVRRIFCVGRNYEAHAREMGAQVDREAPIWFTKSCWSICPSGSTIAYPPGTTNCHFEAELVVAIGKSGFRVDADKAWDLVFGLACGIDLTRRDLQYAARDKGYPWDVGKDFEQAAVIAEISRGATLVQGQRISLQQNGIVRQDASFDDLIWSVPELIADLSRLYHLEPGDLIYTGTPSGVGPVAPGDTITVRSDDLNPLTLTIGPKE